MSYPLVILHGWGASAKSYDKLKPLLEQKGISVFVFDLPGFGNEPAPKSAWAVDDYADWVLSYIEKKNLEKFYLFGHSFGGRIAIKIAAKEPEKLAGLILCDAAGITPRPKATLNLFWIISMAGNIIFSLPLLNYLKPIARKSIYFFAGTKDYNRLQNPAMKDVFRKVVEEDLTLHLDRIKTPTLIVWGKKDKETPVSDAYAMKEKIQNSEVEILEGVGHSPHLECPENLAEIIGNFVSK